MKTTLDCLPCFLKQTLQTARLATSDVTLQKEILDRIAELLPKLDYDHSPPENSVLVYDTIAQISGCSDPFATIKKKSNELGKSLEPLVQQNIDKATDPLYTACLYSVAGNIIDYGANHDCDAEATITGCLNQSFKLNDYKTFYGELAAAKNLLYLADNSGEIIFDSLVIKQLRSQFPQLNIVLAVKEQAIINDALQEDAETAGIPELCTVIHNGTGCPGSPLGGGLYFLLICKCPVVGGHLQELSGKEITLGDLIFFKK